MVRHLSNWTDRVWISDQLRGLSKEVESAGLSIVTLETKGKNLMTRNQYLYRQLWVKLNRSRTKKYIEIAVVESRDKLLEEVEMSLKDLEDDVVQTDIYAINTLNHAYMIGSAVAQINNDKQNALATS